MRCVRAALVTAACAAAQNEAVAALVAKYKKSAGGSPAAPAPARQPDAPTATATAPARQPEAAPRGVAAAPARQPVAGRAATNDAANLNDVVGLFAWPKKPRTVWAAAKAAITGQPEAPRTFRARPRPATSTNINDDVDAYFKKWRRVVPHCAPLMQGSCVYVAPNGGIVHARDMSLAKNAGSSKQMLADLQLRAVSASLQRVLPEDRWVSWNQV